MLTDDEQRAREVAQAEVLVPGRYPGYQRCRGYPIEHYCPTLVPKFRWPGLCQFCAKTRDDEQREIRASSPFLPSVGEVLRDLPEFERVKACGCGGDAEAPYHPQSLLHLVWAERGLEG